MKIVSSALLMALSLSGIAATNNYSAILNAASSVPPNSSTATGLATLSLDTVTTAFSVSITATGLTADVTGFHTHKAAVGVNGPVVIDFAGSSFMSTNTPTINSGGVFQYNATGLLSDFPNVTISDLDNLLTYVNIHTSTYPSGEIRGQWEAVPEPTTLAVVGLGLLALKRRKA